MKHVALILTCIVVLAGCDNTKRPGDNPPNRPGVSPQADADNTGRNVRDRDASAKTPIDQNENRKDIDVTAKIRKQVVDTKMSVNAQNVKIITQDGRVTLRGPVKSMDEKTRVETIAREVAGAANVDSQLEVAP